LAGIYLHIPFCRQACNYCNFHFTTSLRNKGEMVVAILREAEMRKDEYSGETIHTIYFGGGTPSLLEVAEISAILNGLKQWYNLDGGAEITLEANPDDIDPVKAEGWKQAGVNRLSIGVQSFFENELQWMNRAHNSTQSLQSLELAKSFFDNITMDLIYGSPLLTNEMWEENLDKAIALGIPHLSCYALTVEEKTPLHKSIFQKQKENVDSERQAEQFLMLMKKARAAGYEHYEVSNFAKPGFRSRHNSSYWKGEKYLGLGPSAHSYDGASRQWNIANNQRYMQGIAQGKPEVEKELLSETDRLNEYIMISLRTMEGINLDDAGKRFGSAQAERLQKALQKYVTTRLLNVEGGRYWLTDEGMLRADGIASELFIVE
jgi:oxygen-independent coproporphyrinogen III oxidase